MLSDPSEELEELRELAYQDPAGYNAHDSFDQYESYESYADLGEEGLGHADVESEEFIGGLARRLAPVLRSVAPIARRAIGSAIGAPIGGRIGRAVGGLFGSADAGDEFGLTDSYADGYSDMYGDGYSDTYTEGSLGEEPGGQSLGEAAPQIVPNDRANQIALMEHLAAEAAATDNEGEAEAFLGALVPLAASLAPKVLPKLASGAPAMIKGLAGLGRTLRQRPRTRPLTKAAGGIARDTVAQLANQAAQGQPITPSAVNQALQRSTAKTLQNPTRCARALVINIRLRERRPIQQARLG